jgi:hypothetical protein
MKASMSLTLNLMMEHLLLFRYRKFTPYGRKFQLSDLHWSQIAIACLYCKDDILYEDTKYTNKVAESISWFQQPFDCEIFGLTFLSS